MPVSLPWQYQLWLAIPRLLRWLIVLVSIIIIAGTALALLTGRGCIDLTTPIKMRIGRCPGSMPVVWGTVHGDGRLLSSHGHGVSVTKLPSPMATYEVTFSTNLSFIPNIIADSTRGLGGKAVESHSSPSGFTITGRSSTGDYQDTGFWFMVTEP